MSLFAKKQRKIHHGVTVLVENGFPYFVGAAPCADDQEIEIVPATVKHDKAESPRFELSFQEIGSRQLCHFVWDGSTLRATAYHFCTPPDVSSIFPGPTCLGACRYWASIPKSLSKILERCLNCLVIECACAFEIRITESASLPSSLVATGSGTPFRCTGPALRFRSESRGHLHSLTWVRKGS